MRHLERLILSALVTLTISAGIASLDKKEDNRVAHRQASVSQNR